VYRLDLRERRSNENLADEKPHLEAEWRIEHKGVFYYTQISGSIVAAAIVDFPVANNACRHQILLFNIDTNISLLVDSPILSVSWVLNHYALPLIPNKYRNLIPGGCNSRYIQDISFWPAFIEIGSRCMFVNYLGRYYLPPPFHTLPNMISYLRWIGPPPSLIMKLQQLKILKCMSVRSPALLLFLKRLRCWLPIHLSQRWKMVQSMFTIFPSTSRIAIYNSLTGSLPIRSELRPMLLWSRCVWEKLAIGQYGSLINGICMITP